MVFFLALDFLRDFWERLANYSAYLQYILCTCRPYKVELAAGAQKHNVCWFNLQRSRDKLRLPPAAELRLKIRLY